VAVKEGDTLTAYNPVTKDLSIYVYNGTQWVTETAGGVVAESKAITDLTVDLEALDTSIYGATGLENTLRGEITDEGARVEGKFAYDSALTIDGVTYNTGFGLTSEYIRNNDGTGSTDSEFWINAEKFKFTNSNQTGVATPFSIDASGATPQVTFNGVVSFSNVSGAGDLASQNSVDLATQVTNKSLANLDSTASTKLGGIEEGATVGADWDSNVTGIPYDKVYVNDDAVALGFNPTFSNWTGTFPAGWGDWSGSSTKVSKETSNVRVGDYAVKFNVNDFADDVGMTRKITWNDQPMPVGTFISGSVDIYIESIGPNGAGKPGLLVRPYYNSTTGYRETKVKAERTVGVWQRIPFTARVNPEERIYGLQIYVMANYGSLDGDFEGVVLFDNLRFAFFDSSVDNTSIKLNSNGTLTGAGGGAVTITGLGYTGDLDANRVTTTSQLTNDSGYVLPTEVAQAVNNNTTTIDGAKITTGSINADKINTNGLVADTVRANATITGPTIFAGKILSDDGNNTFELDSEYIYNDPVYGNVYGKITSGQIAAKLLTCGIFEAEVIREGAVTERPVYGVPGYFYRFPMEPLSYTESLNYDGGQVTAGDGSTWRFSKTNTFRSPYNTNATITEHRFGSRYAKVLFETSFLYQQSNTLHGVHIDFVVKSSTGTTLKTVVWEKGSVTSDYNFDGVYGWPYTSDGITVETGPQYCPEERIDCYPTVKVSGEFLLDLDGMGGSDFYVDVKVHGRDESYFENYNLIVFSHCRLEV
jgi:hypothetical protein